MRPGSVSLAWLKQAVADMQSVDRLRRVSVVVASPYLESVVKRTLAESGCANVRILTLREVAARVAGQTADGAKQPLTGVLEAAAIRRALQSLTDSPFGEVAHHQSLHDALGGLFRELRHLDDPTELFDTLASRGSVPRASVAAFRRYVDLSADFYDVPELARLAATAADDRARGWADDLGALVLYLPSRLDAAEIRMLGAVGRRAPVLAAMPHLGEAAADCLMIETARQLATALGTPLPTCADVETISVALPDIISATDPAEEARIVVRRIAGDLEDGVPLWRIAVLYGTEDVYGGLVREALDAAELPWHAATGRPLDGCWAARSLLGLLSLPERRFAREAVLEWLSDRPPTGQEHADPLPPIPVSVWDRLSRQAQVLEGPRQWVERFEALALALQGSATRASLAGADEEEPAPPTDDVTSARAIAAAIGRLSADTRAPDDGAPWDTFVDWAASLRARYVPANSAWPSTERTASDNLDTALESLRDASVFEAGTTARTFRTALASILASRRLAEGEPGRGVVVGPIGTVVGAAFQRVYVLGVAEGTFPSRPPADPLVAATGGDDPLARHERAREVERRGFLAALAAADGGRVALSYARSDGAARATYPSRWLLDLLSLHEGRAVYASDMPALLAAGRPWLTRVASAQDGAARVGAGELRAADLSDLRLAGVVSWRTRHRDLARHPLARRTDLPLGAALRAAQARHSRTFTDFDGNLTELAGRSALMVRAFETGKASATSIERWATCHFQYLLQDILRVQATQRPEDEWTITALDRGAVMHQILERFFRELHEAGRLRNGDRLETADHERLEAVASEELAQLELQGATGHPLAWENARTAILVDLHELLEKDQAWRDTDPLRPSRFEQRFGVPHDPTSWPAVTVTLADGRALSFAGVIDRLDVSSGSSPRQALIIDYKTGGVGSYADLQEDPLAAGRHIQLAVYTRALLDRLDGQEPWDVRAEYRFVTAKGGFKRIDVDADPALDRRLNQVLQWVADGVGAGVFLPVPGERDRGSFRHCGTCAYDRVCSPTRDESWERKHRALPPLDGPDQA